MKMFSFLKWNVLSAIQSITEKSTQAHMHSFADTAHYTIIKPFETYWGKTKTTTKKRRWINLKRTNTMNDFKWPEYQSYLISGLL